MVGVGDATMESMVSASFAEVNEGFANSHIGINLTIVHQTNVSIMLFSIKPTFGEVLDCSSRKDKAPCSLATSHKTIRFVAHGILGNFQYGGSAGLQVRQHGRVSSQPERFRALGRHIGAHRVLASWSLPSCLGLAAAV